MHTHTELTDELEAALVDTIDFVDITPSEFDQRKQSATHKYTSVSPFGVGTTYFQGSVAILSFFWSKSQEMPLYKGRF